LLIFTNKQTNKQVKVTCYAGAGNNYNSKIYSTVTNALRNETKIESTTLSTTDLRKNFKTFTLRLTCLGY